MQKVLFKTCFRKTQLVMQCSRQVLDKKCAQHQKQKLGSIRIIFHLSFFLLFYSLHKHNVEIKKKKKLDIAYLVYCVPAP